MLQDRRHTDYEADRQRRVENPGPVAITECTQQKKKQDEIEPRPHAAHPLEVAKKTVHPRR